MAALDQLSGLMNLIGSVQGKSSTQTTSGGTKTQTTKLSDAAVQEQIKRILAGPGGVRDIGNSARKSGLYNNTSEETLLGNLYATAANQGEIARAPIVTTSTPTTTTTETPGAGIGTVAGTIAGGALLSSILNSDAVGNGVTSLIDSLGFGSSSGSSKKANNITDYADTAINFGSGPGNVIGITGSLLDGSVGGGSSNTFSGDILGSSAGLGLPGIESSMGSTASGNPSKGNDEFDLLGSVGSAISGFFSGGGLGGLVGAVTGGTGSTSGGAGGSSGGSIICTALMEKDLLDKEHYKAGDAYIQKVSPITKVGYYYWAQGIAEKIRNGHKGWTRTCLPFARGRTALLASNGTFMDHVKHPLGSLTKFIGEPVCHLIGLVISEKTFLKIIEGA